MTHFKALLLAATAFLKVMPLLQLRSMYKDLEKHEDEIFNLAASGSAADELRMEVLNKRRDRINQHIRTLRSSIGDLDQG